MPPQALLGKYELAINRHFEQTTRGFNQVHLGIRVFTGNLGRQTGGPRFVVSDNAILDRNVQSNLLGLDLNLADCIALALQNKWMTLAPATDRSAAPTAPVWP